MGDTIRIDVDELAAIAVQLQGIVLDMDRISDELQRIWRHLPEKLDMALYPEIRELRNKIIHMIERAESASTHVMYAADEFSNCDRAARKRFDGCDVGYSLTHSVVFDYKNKEFH